MYCKQMTFSPRWIARLFLNLATVSGLSLVAEPPAIRLSAPPVGWVLSPDGSHVLEITGIMESPRTGLAYPLPSAARRAWSAPDARSVLLLLDIGVALRQPGGQVEIFFPAAAGTSVSAAWDRASRGFAVCAGESCQARSADGTLRREYAVAAGTRVLAYSDTAGIVLARAEQAEWRRGSDAVNLEFVPAAAAFRGTQAEIWYIAADGRIAGTDAQGVRSPIREGIADPLGLVSSADGGAFFAANALGEAERFTPSGGAVDRFSLEDTVEGVWAAPGFFAVQLQESAKRPIAIWNGETGVTGWAPAWASSLPAATEVRQ